MLPNLIGHVISRSSHAEHAIYYYVSSYAFRILFRILKFFRSFQVRFGLTMTKKKRKKLVDTFSFCVPSDV